MSSVLWDGDNLIQRVGDDIEGLGHVKYDEHSNTHVLWLRDSSDVFGVNKGYVRGDSFPSMGEAKLHAASSTSARLFHFMWLVGLRTGAQASDVDVAQAIADTETGRPLTVSTFKAEMEKFKAELEKSADNRERNAKRQNKWYFFAGAAISLIPLVLYFV